MKIKSVIVILVLCSHGHAQQSVLLNQSIQNLYILSPGAIGLNPEPIANCHYKKNWMRLSESPELVQLTIEGDDKNNKLAFGTNILNEKAGIFSKTAISAAIRYKLKITNNQSVYFGISGGFQRQLSDFSKMNADAPDEFSQWPERQAVTIPDVTLGLLYKYKNFLLTASFNQILEQSYSYTEPVFNKEFSYQTVPIHIFSVQNRFKLRTGIWSMVPYVILRTTHGLPVQYEAGDIISYKSKIHFSFGYRTTYASYFGMAFHIYNNLKIAYTYEYSSGIQAQVRGGHELSIGLGLAQSRKTKPSSPAEDKNEGVIKEIFEKIDKQEQISEIMNDKLDSLDRNITLLKTELDSLKQKQITHKQIIAIIDSFFSDTSKVSSRIQKHGPGEHSYQPGLKYKVINPSSEAEYDIKEDSLKYDYKIVFGVYQQIEYAKSYQKFLKREISYDTRLIQLKDQPKKYIYVYLAIELTTLADALTDLKKLRSELQNKPIEITNGQPWILQTLDDR